MENYELKLFSFTVHYKSYFHKTAEYTMYTKESVCEIILHNEPLPVQKDFVA